MPQPPASISDEIGTALGSLADAATGIVAPTLRLGVTGLSRSGKTIFITSLIHNLIIQTQLLGFDPVAENRLLSAEIVEHPDSSVPRFDYRGHLRALSGEHPAWPESTSTISQIRLQLKFHTTRWYRARSAGVATLNLDIVDYPGEWLLDLPLLSMDYATWSLQALERASRSSRVEEATPFIDALTALDPFSPATDDDAARLGDMFTAYLRTSREDGKALSSLPPGRFLLPGDLAGSPLLAFAPLPPPEPGQAPPGGLYRLMERRFEAYKDKVVRPFYRDHFVRLDRQIVLVDALRAINAGPEAVVDLEVALSEVLACFRTGRTNPLTRLVRRRIDRILFAATKADHLHSSSHPALEKILNRLVINAKRRATASGLDTASMAIAAIRATREGVRERDGKTLPVVIGTPAAGERAGDNVYDGHREISWFPGLPPSDAELVLRPGRLQSMSFLSFLPPQNIEHDLGGLPVLHHIRLDKALNFLIGDYLA